MQGGRPGWSLGVLSVAALGCAASRPLRPLPAGTVAAEVSLPAVWEQNGGNTYPVGAPVVGVRYGVTDRTEAALRWNPGLLILGIVGIEGAGVWHVRAANGWIPAVHLCGTLSLMVAPAQLHDGVRGALAADVTAHWEPLPWLWPYLVEQDAVILASGQHVASAFLGAQLPLSPRWDLSLETGLAGWNLDARRYSQPYLNVLGRGALWLGGAVTCRFGAAARPDPEKRP
jgi:hypothetical protein